MIMAFGNIAIFKVAAQQFDILAAATAGLCSPSLEPKMGYNWTL